MDDRITPGLFHAAEGVEDWHVVRGVAEARFATGSFATGVALVDAVGRLADAADHHPDVDLRYGTVTVRLVSHDVGGLSERDVALAREVSAAARDLGVHADPSGVQAVALTVEAMMTKDVLPFWQAVLGYASAGDDEVADPAGRWPAVRFVRSRDARPQRNRVLVALALPHDLAEERVAAALGAGGSVVGVAHDPQRWTLADAEGNEVEVATWQERG
ncbi:4a-hydroxytetrahydrobiopterin dehydratase [Cellulomonas triticagri]|uniref:Putative pterin-4-alpha-carbinolamine dehydratase n=1 Tax=Cellulomonas triticagri TaxID=2483352 RepID=A0A3M2JNM9_9CELL|nr:4a-hydroxytetrahydrobiopterin dehydratase [Cellulomonas triticagri]RMI13906.1 4a-hydroxytetrahydrobiopterin dehydratase [Cellulomonas triticagri]